VRALQASVAPDLFTGFDPTRWPDSSVPALSLAAAALDVGVEEGEAVALALRTALFEDGLDVADSVLLDEIASAHGVVLGDPEVGRSRVLADWREGQERGVVGSPHFSCGRRGHVLPHPEDQPCPRSLRRRTGHSQLH